jgi:lysophospholipase L1-like esterase
MPFPLLLDPKNAQAYVDLPTQRSSCQPSSRVAWAGAFRPDNLHPLATGYNIWGSAAKDKLADHNGVNEMFVYGVPHLTIQEIWLC